MKICRITIDLAYEDSAKGAPKTDKAVWKLIEKNLDPELGEYVSCSSGVLVKHIDFPDPAPRAKEESRAAWFRHAEQQLALLDIERFAVTQAVTPPQTVQRVGRKSGAKK